MAIQNTFASFNFRNLWLTRKNFVQAIGIGVTGLILLILGIQQGTGSIQTYSKIESEQKKLDLFNKKIQELELVKISEEFSQAAEVDAVLPSHKPLLELLNNLNSVATETEISITEFDVRPGEIATDSTQVAEGATSGSVKKARKSKNYDQLDLALKVEGELEGVQKFMNLIERVAPFTTITNLSLNRKSAGGRPTKVVQADLSLSTFFYTQSIAATISAPLPQITDRERGIFQAIVDFTPSNLKQQTEIISSDKTDLFGISGLSVKDLEQREREEEAQQKKEEAEEEKEDN